MQSIIMLSVKYKPFMLSVIMLSVIMLNIVAPLTDSILILAKKLHPYPNPTYNIFRIIPSFTPPYLLLLS